LGEVNNSNNKNMFKRNVLVLVIIIMVLGLAAALVFLRDGEESVGHGSPDEFIPERPNSEIKIECVNRGIEDCSGECVVCPPCHACSSISCQTEAFCSDMGIDRDWYERVRNKITNFDECEQAGYDIMESYPRKCRYGDGVFTEDIEDEIEK
jgi:hypothetical protein